MPEHQRDCEKWQPFVSLLRRELQMLPRGEETMKLLCEVLSSVNPDFIRPEDVQADPAVRESVTCHKWDTWIDMARGLPVAEEESKRKYVQPMPVIQEVYQWGYALTGIASCLWQRYRDDVRLLCIELLQHELTMRLPDGEVLVVPSPEDSADEQRSFLGRIVENTFQLTDEKWNDMFLALSDLHTLHRYARVHEGGHSVKNALAFASIERTILHKEQLTRFAVYQVISAITRDQTLALMSATSLAARSWMQAREVTDAGLAEMRISDIRRDYRLPAEEYPDLVAALEDRMEHNTPLEEETPVIDGVVLYLPETIAACQRAGIPLEDLQPKTMTKEEKQKREEKKIWSEVWKDQLAYAKTALDIIKRGNPEGPLLSDSLRLAERADRIARLREMDLYGHIDREEVALLAELHAALSRYDSQSTPHSRFSDPQHACPKNTVENQATNCCTEPWMLFQLALEGGMKPEQFLFADVQEGAGGLRGWGHGALLVQLASGEFHLFDANNGLRRFPLGLLSGRQREELMELFRYVEDYAHNGIFYLLAPVRLQFPSSVLPFDLPTEFCVLPTWQAFTAAHLQVHADVATLQKNDTLLRSSLFYARNCNPSSPEPLVGLAEYEREQGNTAAAEAYFRDALLLQPAHPVALTGLAAILIQRKEYAEARGCLERVVKNSLHAALSDLKDEARELFGVLRDYQELTGSASSLTAEHSSL